MGSFSRHRVFLWRIRNLKQALISTRKPITCQNKKSLSQSWLYNLINQNRSLSDSPWHLPIPFLSAETRQETWAFWRMREVARTSNRRCRLRCHPKSEPVPISKINQNNTPWMIWIRPKQAQVITTAQSVMIKKPTGSRQKALETSRRSIQIVDRLMIENDI